MLRTKLVLPFRQAFSFVSCVALFRWGTRATLLRVTHKLGNSELGAIHVFV